MKTSCLSFSLVIYLLINGSLTFAQCNTNLLTNGGFDSPVQTGYGNHLAGFAFNGWTITGAQANIVRLDGSGYVSGPDVAKNGDQYLDLVSGAGTVYQDFTISASSVPIVFGGYFSSREATGYVNWTASIEIYKLPSNTLIKTSGTRNFKSKDGDNPDQETWYYLYGTVTLAPGSYRFVANIGDYGNFDAAFVNIDCVVPINLQSFNGQMVDNTVKLSWQADNLSTTSYFEIEKSDDAVHFESISKINTSTANFYDFTDRNVNAASCFYYRLKMVSIDKRITYSNIIRMVVDDAGSFQIVPNQVQDYVTIRGIKAKGWICLFDLSGKKMLEKEIKPGMLDVNVSLLRPGIYLVQFFNGATQQTRKFFKR